MLVNHETRKLRIHFLASVYGLNDAEITETAILFTGKENLAGINLKVLHPVLCLEGKLSCLRGLPQQNRQDLKHAKILILCLKQFLGDLIEQSSPRRGLKLIERILANGTREDGLNAWYNYGIAMESAIPLDIVKKTTDEKCHNFTQITQIRLPQVLEQIKIKRDKYQKIMKKLNN